MVKARLSITHNINTGRAVFVFINLGASGNRRIEDNGVGSSHDIPNFIGRDGGTIRNIRGAHDIVLPRPVSGSYSRGGDSLGENSLAHMLGCESKRGQE
jgi:hypothetical protein